MAKNKTKAHLLITFVMPTDRFASFERTFMEWLTAAGKLFGMLYMIESFTHEEVE